MAIETGPRHDALLAALDDADWTRVLDAVVKAATFISSATPGDSCASQVISRLSALASHGKWEIRRAVAIAASQVAILLSSAFFKNLPRMTMCGLETRPIGRH